MKLNSYEITHGNVAIHKFMGNEIKTHLGFGECHYLHKKLTRNKSFDIPDEWDLLNLTGEQKKQVFNETWVNVDNDFEGLRYHGNWNWIMPVVDKINAMGKGYNIAMFKTYISLTVEKDRKFYKDFHFSHSEYITPEQSGNQAMFNLIVSFIIWHNKQK